MTPTTTLPVPVLPPDVVAFAIDNGVERYLRDLVVAVRQLFPDSPIDVLVKDDPELSYNRQIVFAVDANGRSGEEEAAAQDRWAEESFRRCPATHLHLFSLIQV